MVWGTVAKEDDQEDEEDETQDRARSFQQIVVEINGDERYRAFVHTAQDDLAAPFVYAKSPIRAVGSPHALALARQQIDECFHGHKRCIRAAPPRLRLPTRLVDCTDLARPRLVTTMEGERSEYLALSYVWGEDQIHKTTESNVSTYAQGIAPSLLPQTIRDAIRVTHMLGFQWLWVDCLCIIQDSDEDKAHEISYMYHIYRHALLTIVAGSSENVTEGFLRRRDAPRDEVALPFICPIWPPVVLGHQDDNSTVQPTVGQVHLASLESVVRSPSDNLGRMATSAWCMQEYLMSRRALIFTPTTLMFKCLTAMHGVGNSLCSTFAEPRLPTSLFLPTPLYPDSMHGSKEWKDLHTAWMKTLDEYSSRLASDESEKLVACAAVAEQFHRVLGSHYLAGLWLSDTLLTDLLWEADRHASGCRHTCPPAYRAPSWSWAAVEGVVRQYMYSPDAEDIRAIALAEIAYCWTTLEDPALPFGRVTGGSLVLRGTLIPCHGARPVSRDYPREYLITLPSLEQARRQELKLRVFSDVGGKDDSPLPESYALVTLDYLREATETREMWIVPFVRVPKGNGYEVLGIVLELVSSPNFEGHGNISRFRRIGRFWDSTEMAAQDMGSEHPLWDPLVRDWRNGETLQMDIEIV